MAEPLCGTYTPSIDAKGRMSFPTKLRDILGSEFYLCPGYEDKYIAVFSIEEFNDYCRTLKSMFGDLEANKYRRKLLISADRQTPDKQGRIFISQALREYAGITNEVTVVGNLNRAEIWNSQRLAENLESIDDEKMQGALSKLML